MIVMQILTLEQLRATIRAGGIASVTLKAEGGAFLVAVATRSGSDGLLVTTRTKEPRRFADLRKAMLLLREMGIATVQVDATRWNPDEIGTGTTRPDRAAAMKHAHEAAAHDRWFRAQVEEGLREADDPAAVTLPHEQVMAEMKATIHRVAAKTKKSGGRGR
jgi:hypothetical protein